MSIRRSNNGQTNNNINRGFAVTQTGAIGFSEDVETERFCSALKNNQSMQTQQQMISDLQQKLEKLTTSSTATQNESITNNRDAFARISQGSWPYTASAAMDSGSQLFTGEDLKIEGLEIYKKQALQKAMSEMEQSKKVIRSRILQMMLSYTNLKGKFDVGTMTWKDGSELVDKRWIKKNQKTSQLHLEDVFYSVSYLSEKCKRYNSLFKHQTEKRFIVQFDKMRNQMKTERDNLILKWLNAGILLRANKDVKQMMETIEICKSAELSKRALDAKKVLGDMEEGYVFVNNKLQSLPKGSTLITFQDGNGTVHQMERADVKRAMNFYICVQAYEKLTEDVKKHEARIADFIAEIPDSATGQKSTKQNATPQSYVGGQAAGSVGSGANGQAAGGANGIFAGKGGSNMETEESEFTAGRYHNEESHYKNRGMTMHHHKDKKNHHDHDHKHGMHHNHHDDNDEDAEETGFCMCADPVPVRAVNTSSGDFCRCANPVPVSTATLSPGEKNAYRQLYGPGNNAPKYNRSPPYHAHSHGTRNNSGPHHNTRSRSGGRSKRRFGTKGRNHYLFNEFEDASSHKYLFQGNEFDDYM
jgi:hypothetical protein